MRSAYTLSWLIYGVVVVASSCYRYFTRPEGEKGLYVMGAASILAALLLRSGRRRSGHVAGFLSLAFVIGWYLYESLLRNDGNREQRLLLVAGLSFVQLGFAVTDLRRHRSS